MPYASDGSAHHSLTRVRMHEEKNSKPKPKAASEPEEKKPMAEEGSGDIKEVVAKHGPAHEMHYHHDKETNKHHVHTKHGDENVEHKSEHDSPEDAHDHMTAAMGQDQEESPDEEMGEEAGEAMPEMEHASSHHIPGL